MRTAAGTRGVRATTRASDGLGVIYSAHMAIVVLAALSLVLAIGAGLRGPASLALLAGGGLGSILLFVLGPAPRWPAALLVAGSIALGAIAYTRSALWIDVVL